MSDTFEVPDFLKPKPRRSFARRFRYWREDALDFLADKWPIFQFVALVVVGVLFIRELMVFADLMRPHIERWGIQAEVSHAVQAFWYLSILWILSRK